MPCGCFITPLDTPYAPDVYAEHSFGQGLLCLKKPNLVSKVKKNRIKDFEKLRKTKRFLESKVNKTNLCSKII
jgi:hypothetical protein